MLNTYYGFPQKQKKLSYKLVATSEIQTVSGKILIEQYDDGDAVLSFNQGETWFDLSKQDQIQLSNVFKKTRSPSIVNAVVIKQKPVNYQSLQAIPENGSKKHAVKKRIDSEIARNVRKGKTGWLANLSATETFCYASRSQARCASITDTIGMNGRVA